MGLSLAQQTDPAELRKYPPAVIAKLRYRWDFWARPEQRAPEGRWLRWLLLAGRGFGKTRTASEWIREQIAESREPLRIALVGRTAADTRDVMVTGRSGLCKIYPPGQEPVYVPSKRSVVWPNGSTALMFSGEDPETIKGPEFHIAWVDEIAKFQCDLFEFHKNLSRSVRLDRAHKGPQTVYTTTPKPRDFFFDLVENAEARRCVVTYGSSLDNADNLPEDRVAEDREEAGTFYGRQEVLGQLIRLEGALFRDDWIRELAEAPSGGRVVIGVDPAISQSRSADQTGIVVAKRVGDLAYVLEDLTTSQGVEVWPGIVADAAKRHRAQLVVVERDRGGDAMARLLRLADPRMPIKEVNAAGAKAERALPVASLYERGRVFHCGGKLVELKKQLIAYDPSLRQQSRNLKAGRTKSPDRMDALVMALSEMGLHLHAVKFHSLSVELPKTTF